MAVPAIWTLAIFSVALAGSIWFLLWFNRDPERDPPSDINVVVSPADGTIIYVKSFRASESPVPTKFGRKVHLEELDKHRLFPSGGHIIGIYLSPFDVHVNRAPISGKALIVERRSGKLFSKRLFGLKATDGRNTLVIEGDGIRIGVVQMAAYLVRRVILDVESSAYLKIGERIGKIRLGSQVDLILSDAVGLRILVKPGIKIRAGESIVATFRNDSVSGSGQVELA